MPRVSVVTGLYNHKPFLSERVRSILSQTMRDFEWIVVDDASTDGSHEEISRLTASDPRVRVLRNEINLGFMRTNQRGLDLARGHYLYRADSDDSCDPRFLQAMTGLMDAHPRTGFAYCRSLRMDQRNGVWGGFPKKPARHVEAPDAFPELALNYTIRSPALLFRRDTIEAVGGFACLPPGAAGEWHADWHLALRVALVADLRFHPEGLAYHRTHGTNLSNRMGLTLNNLALLADIFDHLPESCRHFETLRREAYRRAANGMFGAAEDLRNRGLEAEFQRALAMIGKYLPDFEPPRADPVRRIARTAAFAVIKAATYRKLRGSS